MLCISLSLLLPPVFLPPATSDSNINLLSAAWESCDLEVVSREKRSTVLLLRVLNLWSSKCIMTASLGGGRIKYYINIMLRVVTPHLGWEVLRWQKNFCRVMLWWALISKAALGPVWFYFSFQPFASVIHTTHPPLPQLLTATSAHSAHIHQADSGSVCHIPHHPICLRSSSFVERAQACHLRDKLCGGNLYPLRYAG